MIILKESKKYRLKQDTMFSTGYLGRGIPSKARIFKAGTEFSYTKTVTRSGIYHTATIYADGIKWEVNKKEPL
jgi:hypothetical protein